MNKCCQSKIYKRLKEDAVFVFPEFKPDFDDREPLKVKEKGTDINY